MNTLNTALQLARDMPGVRPTEATQEWMEAVLTALHEGYEEAPDEVKAACMMVLGETWMSKFRRYLNLDGAPEAVKLVAGIYELASAKHAERDQAKHIEEWVLPLLEEMTDPGSVWVKKQLRAYQAPLS